MIPNIMGTEIKDHATNFPNAPQPIRINIYDHSYKKVQSDLQFSKVNVKATA